MSKFYMLIGLPGSGKSTYAINLAMKEGAEVFSSDEIRAELFGSEAVQDKNEEVFQVLHSRLLQALESGKTVIYDATNINSKQRRHTLFRVSKFAEDRIAVFIATPYKTCIERSACRERQVPEYVLKRMYMNFTVPCKNEGFTDVRIVYPPNLFMSEYILAPYSMASISHDNPHHTASIGNHMIAAYNELVNYDYDMTTAIATLIHDIGKPFTKTFVNCKGEQTEIAHYYNHNNVGAYDSFFLDTPEELKINVALLIQYHMNYYTSWKSSEKAFERDREFLGEELFKKLEILHSCDIAAH